jgi:uncharacterized protein YqeY
MKARDTDATAALRSALSAIANAEAVETNDPPASLSESPIAGATAGLKATEAHRRTLSADDIAGLIRAERDSRLAAGEHYDELGEHEEADRLRAEADVLARYI